MKIFSIESDLVFPLRLVVEVGFSQAVYTVTEGEGEILFTITKSGSNDRDVGVTFATEQNTAISKRKPTQLVQFSRSEMLSF